MPQGSYKIWPVDKSGKLLDYPQSPTALSVSPSPTRPEAVDIYYGLQEGVPLPPPKDQSDLQERLQKVLRAVQLLYSGGDANTSANDNPQFRNYYIRLYRLAQLGLEGANVSPEIATSALTSVTADLIDDEASRVKNKHLKSLGKTAFFVSVPFAIAYPFLRSLKPDCAVHKALVFIGVHPAVMANFMLLWIGCFLGVWLSYGIRTTTFSLSDLTITDADRLVPVIRLIFAGSLTMLLGIVFVLPLVELKVGARPITDFTTEPMLAFLLGSFCGISELLLPTAVAKRASDFIGSIK